MVHNSASICCAINECSTKRSDVLSLLQSCSDFLDCSQQVNGASDLLLVYQTILQKISHSFLGCLTSVEQKELFERLFLTGPPDQALLAISSYLSCRHLDCFALQKSLSILERVIKERFALLLERVSLSGTMGTTQLEQELLQAIVSLPDRISSVLKDSSQSIPYNNRFCKKIVLAVFENLTWTHARLTFGQDTNLRFVSNLIGKLYISGHSTEIVTILIPWLARKCNSSATVDFVWCRIAQRLISHCSLIKAQENLVTEVTISIRDDDLSHLLGDVVLGNQIIRYLICHKLLLSRVFPMEKRVPEKIASYLASGLSRRPLLVEAFKKLLSVWSDQGAVMHSSEQQRQYLCRAVVVFARQLISTEIESIRGDITALLLDGMSAHLEAISPVVRIHGMVVGEVVSSVFNTDCEKPLKFEYDTNSCSAKELLAPSHVDTTTVDANLAVLDKAEESLQSLKNDSQESNAEVVVYDSDDDLQPYDIPSEELTEDVAKTDDGDALPKPSNTPVFIRDCLEGLYEDKEYARFEASFFAVESLVKKNAVGLSEVIVEVTQRLVHLEDKFATENFDKVRLSALVACCAAWPGPVTNYLIVEFFSRNYTITQRLLMLDVLAATSKELSGVAISASPIEEKKKEPLIQELKTKPKCLPNVPEWRKIVDDRIESNSRRFAVDPNRNVCVPKMNKFSPVAPLFFFPLLSAPNNVNESGFDLFGRDYVILARLLHTLGTVLLSAQNSPSSPRMAEALFQLLWPLRFHQQSFVRQSVIFCISMISLTLPPQILAVQLRDICDETVAWLRTLQSDPSPECQKLAETTSVLLCARLAEGIKASLDAVLKV